MRGAKATPRIECCVCGVLDDVGKVTPTADGQWRHRGECAAKLTQMNRGKAVRVSVPKRIWPK